LIPAADADLNPHVALNIGAPPPQQSKYCQASGWGDCAANYVGKPFLSSLAGWIAMTPLALAVGATVGGPVGLGAYATISAVGGMAGMLANIAKHCGQKGASETIMKAISAFYRAQASGAGSAAWSMRFPTLEEATALTNTLADAFGWDVHQSASMVALIRTGMTVAYTMGVADLVAATNVVTTFIQEMAARAAELGDTPMVTPDVENFGKGIRFAFGGESVLFALDMARNLEPGETQATHAQYAGLFENVSGSAMNFSVGTGFMVYAHSLMMHFEERGPWTNASEALKKARDAAVKVQIDDAGKEARKQATDSKMPGAEIEEAVVQARQHAEEHATTCRGKVATELQILGAKLKTTYIDGAAGAMYMGVESPFKNVRNPLRPVVDGVPQKSHLADAVGLLGRAATSPLPWMALRSALELHINDPENKSKPSDQTAVLVFLYAAHLCYWAGVLANWINSRAPIALEDLRATPRELQGKAFDAATQIVGAFGLAFAADHFADEFIADRHLEGDEMSDISALCFTGAGIIGLVCLLGQFCKRAHAIDSERAAESTLLLMGAAGAGLLDAEQYGAAMFMGGVALGEGILLVNRFTSDRNTETEVMERAVETKANAISARNAKGVEASIKAAYKNYEKMTEQQRKEAQETYLKESPLGLKLMPYTDVRAVVGQVESMYAGSQDKEAFSRLLDLFPDGLVHAEYGRRGLEEYKGVPPSGGGGALAGPGLGPMTIATTATAGASSTSGPVPVQVSPHQVPNSSRWGIFGAPTSSSSTDSTTTTTTATTGFDPLTVHVPSQPRLTPPSPTSSLQASQLPSLNAFNSSSFMGSTATTGDPLTIHTGQAPSDPLPAVPDIPDLS
jgi:hypothetical protein